MRDDKKSCINIEASPDVGLKSTEPLKGHVKGKKIYMRWRGENVILSQMFCPFRGFEEIKLLH